MLRPDHSIFRQPFVVTPSFELIPSPDNFKRWQPGFPDTVETFAIFTPRGDKEEPGLVTSDAGFVSLPDAELVLGGINMKGPRYAAVARHGSFVMWGFHCLPEQLTDTGRRLFLNSLAYAVAHQGALVETLRQRPTRDELDRAIEVFVDQYPAEQRLGVLTRHLGGEALPPALADDAAARRSWLAARRPFLRPVDDGSNWSTAHQLAVDPQVQQIGVGNASFEFLDRLAARLAAGADDQLATTLLQRYVPDVPSAAFADWLRTERERLYFTEAGGWVWRVRGTPASSPRLRRVDGEADQLLRLDASSTESTLTITLRVQQGWHAWSPKAKDQSPVKVAVLPGSSFVAAGEPSFTDDEHGMLTGYSEIQLPIRRTDQGRRLRIAVTYTLCDEATCKPPRTVVLER